MDSFYDQPRNAPKPTNINRIVNSALIPEVSIIQPPLGANNRLQHGTPKASYNVWKARQFSEGNSKENREPMGQFCDSNFRKQVRFDSPTLHRSNSYPHSTSRDESNGFRSNSGTSKPFEQIYMANIPNRKLDLSISDNQVKQNNTKSCSGENCYDIYNYKRDFPRETLDSRRLLNKLTDEPKDQASFNQFKSKLNVEGCRENRNGDSRPQNNHNYDKPCETEHTYGTNEYYRTNSCQTLQTKEASDDPTMKDLLKVIQQQNEQILLLQKQVACLLEAKSNQKQIEDTSDIEQPQFRKPVHSNNKKGPLSKFAIDVMTSFEVSIRPPQNNGRNKYAREILETAKIQEITDVADRDNTTGNVLDGIKKNETVDEVSISLVEPLDVRERCQSPEQSIHVDMQDYSSDDEDSSESSADIGWTLYNNIMGQVNNIFKNQGTQGGNPQTPNDIKEKTLKTVKEATMKHLKSVGVNLPLIDEDEDSAEVGDKYNPTEVSFAVKQLLMKYLPNEHLAKLTYNETKRLQRKQPENCGNFIKRRPDFSFATVQYMKKYNLLASDGSKDGEQTQQPTNNPKILDVTALKRQPKLL